MASTMVARAHTGDALAHLVEVASALADLQQSAPPPPASSSAIRRRASQSAAADADYVSVVSDSNDEESAAAAAAPAAASFRRGPAGAGFSKRELFPQRLHEILRDASLADVAAWLPHGTAFVVLRPDVFTAEVLPKYLPSTDARGSTKYASFTRKLNRWGFRQATRGADTGAFSHPLFLRDRPELCRGMVCQRSRDSSSGDKSPGAIATAAATSKGPRKPATASATQRRAAPAEEPPVEARMAPVAPSPTKKAPEAAVPATGAGASLRAPPEGITRDRALVDSVLKQRDEVERLRVAKQMLFESYMQALQQQQQPTTSSDGEEAR